MSPAVHELTAENCSSSLNIHLGDYNLFLLEDYSEGRNVQGKVAAGRNLTLTGFSVGAGLTDENISSTLVAGGVLTVSDGAVWGDTWYGGSRNSTRVSYRRGTVAQGTPIDFVARFAELRSLSSQLAAQQINGTTRREAWGGVMMSGADPRLNVFEVNASAFTGAVLWSIEVPASSFVVVNIRGTPPTFNRFDIPGNSINARRVLYNFVDATTLTVENHRLTGTVLAPHARVTFRNGGWYGGIYAVSLVGNATGNLNPLDEFGGEVECQQGDTASCTTSCGSTGIRVCGASCTWGACTPPMAEACNGVDDNCNGQIDEGFECTGSSGRSCTAGCGATGTQLCNPATCTYGACTSSSCCQADADCGAGSYCEGSLCTPQRGNGASCSGANQCASGQCVDGVCCNTACGGPCDACNMAGRVGTCSLAPSTVQCRASGGVCDVAEYCTGTGASCPADGFLASGFACSSDSNACTSDVCDGTGGCTHPLLPAGTACGAWQSCDATGQCVGEVQGTECWIGGVNYAEGATNPLAACQECNPSMSTSSWSFKPSTAQCRASAGVCDVAEYCTGTGAACPADAGADGASCGTAHGGWGSCGGFSDFCDTTGTQSRTVTASTCGARTCNATSSSTETQACTRAAPDTSCAAPSYGGWSACSYTDDCAQTGTQSRTVTSYSYSCASGQCMASTSTETQACTRNTGGNSCGPPSYGGWSSCEGFSDTCDETGTQSRSATTYTCSNGTCGAFTSTETQVCSRGTAGTACGTSLGNCSSCSGFNGACGQTGTQSCTVTNYTCSGGTCNASSTGSETRGCSRNTNGTICEYSESCDECSASDFCSQWGTQWCSASYSTCAGERCIPQGNTSYSQECYTSTPPPNCQRPPDISVTACSGFSGVCGESGTQSRTVTTYSGSFNCSTGQCEYVSSTSTEELTCSRSTDGVPCETLYGNWTCIYPVDRCSKVGQSYRGVHYSFCGGGTCNYSGSSLEYGTCTVPTPPDCPALSER